MKITDIKVTVLETDDPEKIYEVGMLPGQRRERWMNVTTQGIGDRPPFSGSGEAASKAPEYVMHVYTDEGVEGIATALYDSASHLDKRDLEQLRHMVVGKNPLDRELLYQMLHQGTRWIFRAPGWFGAFDNCLWDIAGKVAGLPVYALLGRVRDKVPAYYNVRGVTIEEAIEDAHTALDQGFTAIKDHYYHPANENIRWLQATREAVGPDVPLMHDCVGIYKYEEAVKVGKALEELDYLWFEEPLPERQHNRLVQLCDRLDIPVLATEMFMYDIDLCAQWLISGATDLIRNNARHGTTQVMKLAHLAELHGTTIELNAGGGLWGLVHAHLLCAIQNTSYYEHFPGGWTDRVGRSMGMLNPVTPENGFIKPPDTPGWGAEWDWKQFKKRTVEVW